MTFSPEWDIDYAAHERHHVADMEPQLWHLIDTFIGRNNLKGQRVIDFGCGTGANVGQLLSYGADYCGIDGSVSAVKLLINRFPALKDRVLWADFTQRAPVVSETDIILDRASIAHNTLDAIRNAIQNVWNALKPGGIYIGCDWFSTAHSECGRGLHVSDTTYSDYPDGQFRGIGKVHFTAQEDFRYLFAGFEPMFLQERGSRRPALDWFQNRIEAQHWISPAFDGVDYVSSVFDFVCRKPV